MTQPPDWLRYAWFDPYRDLIRQVGTPATSDNWLSALNREAEKRLTVNANGESIRFVEAQAMPATAYESTIARTGNVPTRTRDGDAWHDYFNALVWLTFPMIKGRLNSLQARAIDSADPHAGSAAGRGRFRDMLTLFDESAAIVLARHRADVAALKSFEWQALFIDRREAWGRQLGAVVFGHALLMKLMRPYKSVCAQSWVRNMEQATEGSGPEPLGESDAPQTCPASAANLRSIDATVAEELNQHTLVPGCLSPLPVLGVPGWWPENEDPAFYDDKRVFRARPSRGADVR